MPLKNAGLFTAFAALSLVRAAQAQVPDLPDMTGAAISSTVESIPGGGLQFSYTVDNAGGSLPIIGLSMPMGLGTGSWTHVVGLDNSAEILDSSFAQRASGSVVGVTFPSVPPNWNGALTPGDDVDWGALSSDALVSPGESLGGFQLQTRALPGLRQMRVSPDHWDFMPTEADLAMLDVGANEVIAEHLASTQLIDVVAPVAPEDACDPVAFLLRIDSFTKAAMTNHWIRSAELDSALRTQIERMRSSLAVRDFSAARAVGLAYIGLVDADPCPASACTGSETLSSEGIGLLKYNMKYLVDRLVDADSNSTMDGCEF